MHITPVILAAGQGTRMKSDLPKVLHPILGRPLVKYALDAAQAATGSQPVMVVGHGAEGVRQALGDAVRFVTQSPQLGTGHAVMQAESVLRGQTEAMLVTYADMPLLRAETLSALVSAHTHFAGPVSMLTLLSDDSRGFGRVVRTAGGQVQAIVEEAQALPEQLRLRELNVGVYCFSAEWLWPALHRIPLSPKGEYYLTDLIGLAVSDGLPVQAIPVSEADEMIGINTRVHLAEATAVLRQRINLGWMLAGVTLIDPDTTYIEPGVTIGRDTVIWPNTYLHGQTVVGEGCTLGPGAMIRDTRMGKSCKVLFSVLESALLEDQVDVGPYGHLRKGAHLARGVHLGNFGEVKNSYLGLGTKMGHFSYIGDATIGENVNIGAGTITCNFSLDGKKNPTEIGAGAFIGSDTMLVAPVKIGEGAATGSGAVVTIMAHTGLFNFNLARLLSQREGIERRINRVTTLKHAPQRLSASLILTRTILRMVMAGVLLALMYSTPPVEVSIWPIIGLMLAAAVLLVWFEWLLQSMVLRHPERWSLRLAPFVQVWTVILSPFLALPMPLARTPREIADIASVTEDDLKTMVDASEEEGLLEQDERQMIYSIFDLGDTLAREIMVPRIDMLALDVTTPAPQAVDALINVGHSRAPVFSETVDNILGLIYVRDLLQTWRDGAVPVDIRPLLRPAYFVPEAKKVDELLAEMQARRVHMAIVVDEYGGVAGLVTLEDIVEEIVGEIQDEYDQTEEMPYQALEQGEYLFQGRVDLEDFNDVMKCNLPKEEADTLGGFIYSRIGRVPASGESLEVNGVILIVEQVIARRIRKVRAHRKSTTVEQEGDDAYVDG